MASSVEVRAPLRVRLMGIWMLAIFGATTSLAIGLVVTGAQGAVVAILLLSSPLAYYGVRLVGLRASIDDRGLTIRNRWRTHLAPWSKINEIDFEKRPMPWMYRLSLVSDRWTGVVRMSDGTELEVEATDTIKAFVFGRNFTGSKESASSRVDMLRAALDQHKA